MKNSKPVFLTIWILILSTQIAFANGIPVIFAVTVFHLLIINTLVIAIETRLLKRLSKSSVEVWLVIFANLASIFLAYILTDKTISTYLHTEWFGLTAGNGVIERKYFLAGMASFILFTILIEWLFFYFAQENNRKLLTSLKYSAIINLVTNVPIAIYYLVTNNYYDTGD